MTDCTFVQGNAYEIKTLVQRSADFVFMANSFHGVPDRTRLARAVATVLRPQGRFAVVNWEQRPREETQILDEPRGPKTQLRLSSERTVQSIQAAGLSLVVIIEIPPYHYGAVFKA